MPRSSFLRLAPSIADASVDPELEVRGFGTLEGMAELVRRLSVPTDKNGNPGDVDVEAVAKAVAEAKEAIGSTRNRAKASALAVSLHLSLAVQNIGASREALDVLGRALGLDADLARLDQRIDGLSHHWVDDWLVPDSGAGPLPEDMLALKIIAAARKDGPTLPVRRAVWSLFHWYAFHSRSPSAPAVNALAVVAGVVDGQGRLQPLMARHILHRDPDIMRHHVTVDARALLGGKKKAKWSMHLLAWPTSPEDLSRTRKSAIYRHNVDAEVRRLRTLAETELADILIADAIESEGMTRRDSPGLDRGTAEKVVPVDKAALRALASKSTHKARTAAALEAMRQGAFERFNAAPDAATLVARMQESAARLWASSVRQGDKGLFNAQCAMQKASAEAYGEARASLSLVMKQPSARRL